MKHVLKEPSCYRDFCKDAVLHLSLLKIKIFISWAKWGVSYPSFGGCSMSSGWTSHYKTLFLITPLHKANPLNFSACGLYLGFHSWELKVPKLLQYRSETLRGFSFSHHQANQTFTCQKKKKKKMHLFSCYPDLLHWPFSALWNLHKHLCSESVSAPLVVCAIYFCSIFYS